MRRAALLGLALLLGGLLAPATDASVPVAPPIDEEIDCLEPAPRQVDAGATPLDGKRGTVDLLVLLDGVSDADGAAAAKDAKAAYAPIGIDLRVRFAAVQVPADGTTEAFDGSTVPTASTTSAMNTAKRAVGGKVSGGVEVVYLLTAKELYLGEDQPDEESRSFGVAGLADCIGGVAFPHRAFAVGEQLSFGDLSVAGLAMGKRLPGKILAHEIGHLLGAHHHYANCAEHVPAAVLESTMDTCTLMFNDVGVVGLQFSALNRAIVRGHAITYAR
jgi:hypothetical protein